MTIILRLIFASKTIIMMVLRDPFDDYDDLVTLRGDDYIFMCGLGSSR